MKRRLRRFALIWLMVLATVGIGIGGGVPIPMVSKKEDEPTVKIEMVDNQDEID